MGSFPDRTRVVPREHDVIWRTSLPVDRPEGRPESGDVNVGLLAAFVLCLDFWMLLALTVDRLT